MTYCGVVFKLISRWNCVIYIWVSLRACACLSDRVQSQVYNCFPTRHAVGMLIVRIYQTSRRKQLSGFTYLHLMYYCFPYTVQRKQVDDWTYWYRFPSTLRPEGKTTRITLYKLVDIFYLYCKLYVRIGTWYRFFFACEEQWLHQFGSWCHLLSLSMLHLVIAVFFNLAVYF